MTFFCHSGTQDFLFWTFFILWYPHPLPRYLLLHPSVAALPREKGKYLGRGWGTKVWNKVQKKEILLSLRQKNVIRSYYHTSAIKDKRGKDDNFKWCNLVNQVSPKICWQFPEMTEDSPFALAFAENANNI